MNIDEKIKQELETEASTIDEILNDKQGLFELIAGSFKSGIGKWVILINVVIFIVTGLMFWAGYQFFTASEMSDQIFWGICLLLTTLVQIAMKQWVWMEMGRNSILREVKRIEVAIARLDAKLNRN